MKRKFERSNELSGDLIDREVSALAVHDGVVINADLSVGCGFKLECDYTPLIGDSVITSMHAAMRGAMNTLPEHFDLQVIWRQHHRTKEFKEMLSREPSTPGLVGEIQAEGRELFVKNMESGLLRWIEVYFVIVRRCTITRKELRKRSGEYWATQSGQNPVTKLVRLLTNTFTDHDTLFQYQEHEYLHAVNELHAHAENFRRVFNEQGWEPKRLDDNGVLGLFYARWNRAKYEAGLNAPHYRPADQLPLSEYFAHSPIEWTPTKNDDIAAGTLKVDGLFHRIVSLHMPGPNLAPFPYFEGILLHAGLNSMEMVLNITRGSRVKRIKDLRIKLKQRKGLPDDPVEREQSLQLDRDLEELGANREHIWRASVHFILWADNNERLKKDVLRIMTEASRKETVLVEETHAAWAYWRGTQPFWTQDHDRYRMLEFSTQQVACLMPLCGHPTNITADKPLGVLYETSCGSMFNWLLPDGKLFTSPHHIIVGDTGSGKSMFEDEKQIAFRRMGAKSIIIDLGASYLNFCTSSGGVYIDYNLNKVSNRINPFYMAPESDVTPEFIRARTLWLEQLVRDRGQELGGDDVELLEEAVQSTYARHRGKKEIFLHDVRDSLTGITKPRAQVLAGRLGSWCADAGGSKGNLFDGTTMVNFNAPVVVFDLKHVAHDNKDPELLRIIFNSIMALVASLTAVRTKEPKILSFDEAGMLVKDPTNAKFLEYCYRTLRKNGVVVAAMTQDIDDFVMVNPDLANIIVGSVENRVVMKQNNAAKVRRIGEVLGCNGAEMSVIADLRTGPGKFAEFMLMQTTSRKRRSFRLTSACTPLRYAMTCNSNSDLFVMDEDMKKGMSRADAIRAFSVKFPLGVDNTPKTIR